MNRVRANSDTEPDACRANCTAPTCGDGVVDTDEMCDDANNVNGDGCSDICVIEGVPTVSTWGLLALTMLLLVGAKVTFTRRNGAGAAPSN